MKADTLTDGFPQIPHSELEFVDTGGCVEGMQAIKNRRHLRPSHHGLGNGVAERVVYVSSEAILFALLVQHVTAALHLKSDDRCGKAALNQRSPGFKAWQVCCGQAQSLPVSAIAQLVPFLPL